MSNDETPETRMPFYDGDRGWIAPEYKAPTPRFPGKHNLEGGWIFGGGNKKSYYDGSGGWVSEQPNEFPTESSGMSREEILTNKHKPGRRGWVASNWEKVYDKNDPYDTNPNLPVPSQPKPFVQSFQPPYSISNGEKTVVIEIELPGVSPENVSLEIVNQVSQQVPFTSASSEQALVCHRSPTASPASSTNCFLRVMGFKHSKWDKHKVFDEREYGFFERSVFLGNQVNKKSPMMAKLENGILTVCVAKPQQIKDSAAKKAK